MWAAIYIGCLVALFVRVHDESPEARRPLRPARGEPLRLIAWHHRVFYVLLLVAAPAEALWLSGAAAGRLGGALCLVGGVALYRIAGARLGDALSPLVSPREGGQLVTRGVYGWIRHPMYLGQILIAVGAPLTLGGRWTLGVAAVAVVLLLRRMALEDAWLAETYPAHAGYRARVKRWIPLVF
jgi:protein-S-isoprenylcysteine O-methyltransferase Ste14